MTDTADKTLNLIEQKLRFIARQSQQVEGSYDVVDEINFTIVSALRALDELREHLQPDENSASVLLAA
jgi:hypothetical protein